MSRSQSRSPRRRAKKSDAGSEASPVAIASWLSAALDRLPLARDASKRAAERFNLIFSAIWIAVFGTVVATKVYFEFGDVAYFLLGLFCSLPYFLYPLCFPFEADRDVPFAKRYFVVSNVWIAIFSYVGNYFWTHYFYVVLGASYHFPVKLELNGVPLFLYFITHGYFMFYHTFTTLVLRKFFNSRVGKRSVVAGIVLVLVLAVFTAFMETWTISNVPFYRHSDKFRMYTVGSVVYGIYFIVSFPMYYRLAESRPVKAAAAALDALAAGMLVTILLDLYRLAIGFAPGLPWMTFAKDATLAETVSLIV